MSRSLLSVDVEAAIRKFTESQLSRSAMRPLELVRALMGAGASGVRIRREAKALKFDAPDAVVPAELLQLLVDTMSTARKPENRYSALLELEERGGLIWLAIATDRGLLLTCRDGRTETRVELGPDSQTLSTSECTDRPRCSVSLRRKEKATAERELLEQHLRYARRPIELDGARLDQTRVDPSGPLFGVVRGERFEGTVRLRVDEDFSCIRWIDREVLSAERYSQLAGGVAHDAVVHSADSSVRPEAVIAVRDFRERTVGRLAYRFEGLSEPDREAVRHVLFSRAIERGDASVLGDARVFPTVAGEALTVNGLRERARRAPLEVTGLDPGPGAGAQALRLDTRGRRLVTEILGLPIVGGTPFGEGGSLERLRRTVRGGWEASLELAAGQWARMIRGRRIPAARLTEQEREFMVRLQLLLAEGQYRVPRLDPRRSRATVVEFVPRGPLPLRTLGGEWGRGPKLQLPRANPTLQRVIRAHHRDPRTVYPALDLLFAGRDGWGAKRSQWRRAMLESDNPGSL